MRALFVLLLISLCLLSRLAFAAPADVSRTLRTFDFEERRLGNGEDLPMHWSKVLGEGLPHYVNGKFATDRHRSGKYSFRFDLNGGSLIYRYDYAQIKVRPGTHYRIEAWCQTTVLPRARARMTTYFADEDGHAVKNSIRHSELYAAEKEHEPWKRLSIETSVESPDAVYLVLELGLLQPAYYDAGRLGERTLFTQDIRGSAWFDDVAISQVPRVALTTDHPGNIFKRAEPLRLSVKVNDRFTDDLAAQLIIIDATGRTVYQRSGALDISAAENLAGGQKRMTLDLPALPPGWYDAALVITSGGQLVGRESLQLIHLADNANPVPTDNRFGLIATELPFEGWDSLPDLLPILSAGRVKLGIWTATGDIQKMDPGAFDQLIERLQARGITPTACLLDIPPRIAQMLQRDRVSDAMATSWTRLLQTDPAIWRPELAFLIARHANHLDRWQLGADGTDEFVTNPQMREVYKAIYQEFSKLVENPDLAMPWPAWYDLDSALPATIALSVPPSVLPSQIPLYVQDLKGTNASSAGHHNLSLALQLLDRAKYGREVQLRDFAQRVVYSIAAGADRIDLPLPFTVHQLDDTVIEQPQELLMILRTLTTTLSHAQYKGQVPIAEGVEAFLFDRNGQGIIALWDRGNPPRAEGLGPAAASKSGLRDLVLNLGERPVSIDLWGNVTPLLKPPGGGAGDNKVAVTIGQTPLFLLDVDGYMAQLRASVALDRPLLESSFQPHGRKLRFTNPYHQAISGTVRLKAPPGWTLTPPNISFSLNPGETLERDLTIEFPYNSFAGNKTLNVEFQLQADRANAFTVPITLKLGLSDVGMQAIALRDGQDLVIQQQITNYGDKPIDYASFAIFPGQARQERLVTKLAPGKTIMKKYRFPNVQMEPDSRVRVGVKELDGSRILNEEVPVQ